MKREFDPGYLELMDREQPINRDLEIGLLNLRRLNRYFGSHSLIRAFLRRWLKPGCRYAILDIATGGGDIPRCIVEWCRQSRGIEASIDALDFHPATLALAKAWSENHPEIRFFQADILTWESEKRYDLVLCSLALHHFSEKGAIRVMEQCRRFSKGPVLVADLERNRLNSFLVWLVTATFFRHPLTAHDARLSAKRAFSYSELGELALQADWSQARQRRFPPARQAIWCE